MTDILQNVTTKFEYKPNLITYCTHFLLTQINGLYIHNINTLFNLARWTGCIGCMQVLLLVAQSCNIYGSSFLHVSVRAMCYHVR